MFCAQFLYFSLLGRLVLQFFLISIIYKAINIITVTNLLIISAESEFVPHKGVLGAVLGKNGAVVSWACR